MFDGRMGRKRFSIWAAGALAFLAVTVLLHQWSLMAGQGGCGGGACGPVFFLSVVTFRPLLFAIFVFLLIGPCLRRSRDAGLPPLFGLVVPLLFLADYKDLVFAGIWSWPQLGFGFPWYALLGLFCAVVLALLPTVAGPRPPLRHYGLPGVLVLLAGVAIVLSLWQLYWALLPLSGVALGRPVRLAMLWMTTAKPYFAAFFAVSLLLMVWQMRRLPEETDAGETREKAELRLPILRMLLAALTLAVIVILVGFPERNAAPAILLIAFTPIVLPTAALFALPILAIVLLFKRRLAAGIGVGLLSLLPFLNWGYQYHEAAQIRLAGEKRAADLPKTTIASYPPVLVVTGERFLAPDVSKIPGIAQVVTGEAPDFDVQNIGVRGTGSRAKIASLPSSYLLFRMKAERLKEPRTAYWYETPYELVIVRDGVEQPVASTFKVRTMGPAAWPILTSDGWQKETYVQSSSDVSAFGAAFIADALSEATPEG